MRVDLYGLLADAVAKGDTNATDLRRTVILTLCYTNSPRQMFQLYQDAMTIVWKCGKPDLFITFTCNPLWDNTTSNLLPNQKVTDRCTKFKLRELLDVFLSKGIYDWVQFFLSPYADHIS